MQRLKHRPDYFVHRGNRMAYHRHQDGATFSRLDPYAPGEQSWLLNSGRVIFVTAAEVRDIAKQVNDQDLPDTRPTGDWDEARIKSIEERLAALEGQLPIQDQNDAVDEIVDEPELFETEDDINATQALQAELDETREALTIEQQKSAAAEARIAELEAEKSETPPPSLPPDPAGAKLSDYGEVGDPADNDPVRAVEDLIGLLRSNPDEVDARIVGLSSRQRKLLTDSFKERMNELNNRRLRGVKLNEFDGAWLEDHQTLYHKLAETGDGT